VRALTPHQCGLGSNPGVDAICGLSLLLVLFLAPIGFCQGTPVFPSPLKPTYSNSSSIRKGRQRPFMWMCCLQMVTYLLRMNSYLVFSFQLFVLLSFCSCRCRFLLIHSFRFFFFFLTCYKLESLMSPSRWPERAWLIKNDPNAV